MYSLVFLALFPLHNCILVSSIVTVTSMVHGVTCFIPPWFLLLLLFPFFFNYKYFFLSYKPTTWYIYLNTFDIGLVVCNVFVIYVALTLIRAFLIIDFFSVGVPKLRIKIMVLHEYLNHWSFKYFWAGGPYCLLLELFCFIWNVETFIETEQWARMTLLRDLWSILQGAETLGFCLCSNEHVIICAK